MAGFRSCWNAGAGAEIRYNPNHDHASLLVVRSFVRSLSLLEKQKSDFHEIWYRRPASVPNLIVNLSEVKVRVQGQNCRTENRQIVISRPCSKMQCIFTKSGNTTGCRN